MPHNLHTDFVTVDAIRPLRHSVLRPGLPFETTIFEGDDEPTAYHVAAFKDDEIVGVGTMIKRPWTGKDSEIAADKDAYQVRGMAVSDRSRGTGAGKLVLDALETEASALGVRTIWCNARASAAGFYQKAGWQIAGDMFEIPGVGPHFVMVKELS
ncbi:MAG: GNAT family N-acetyltransferase [Candidatus Obscuribacter sp.]|nr:GNAT family N-acetyltransferase [Candidatus Obscuribacter sp.]MBP6347991.1 GNAT family N-acetyltransferase [Candidatus Obscuribacter sp.]MBP6591444.1 GNAT family N-acetyltransferase [Candidatus Obscuribacter sp.]MBP7575130.1 GNAT family N-acetyltransferase [Candidatus Obscuribacter sp.]